MTVVVFVRLLTIPVAMLFRKSAFTVVLVGVWGLFLGMTPIVPGLAHTLNQFGVSFVRAICG